MTRVPVVRLDSVAEVRLGRQRSPKNHSGTHMRPYVRAANVGWGGLLLDDVKSMNFTDEEMITHGLRPGDLLLNEASGSAREVGKAAIWGGEIEGCAFQNTLLRVRPLGPESRYLLHYFRYQAETGAFAAKSRGVGIYHLGQQALASWSTPLPSIDEQRRIVAVLDRSDELRVKRRGSTELTASLAETIFLDMFGDPIVNERGWDRVRLCDLLSAVDSGRSPVCLSRRAEPDEWGVLKLGAVTRCEYDEGENKALPSALEPDRRLEVRSGDLLFSRKNTRQLVGASALVDTTRARLLLSDLIFRLKIRTGAPLLAAYLHQLLVMSTKRRQVQSLAGGSAGSMPNISKTRLLALEVELPPLALQADFAQRVGQVRDAKERLREGGDRLDELFASLQYRAFQGEL